MWKKFGGVVLVLAATATTAAAQDPTNRWSLSFGAGTTPSVSGLYHEAGGGTVLKLPTTVQEKSWSDIYNSGFTMRAGVGYLATKRLEITGAFNYARQDATELSVGTVAKLDLRAQFGHYRDWGLEGGMRWHFAPEAKVDPFVGASAGARWVSAMPATFRVPAAGVVLPDTPFYDDSVVPALGPDFGVQFAIAPRVRLGVEAGLRWTGNLSGLEGLAGTGLENLNDSSSRWTLPVLGSVSVRF